MSSSAAFLAGLGVAASFLPQEIQARAGGAAGWFPELVIQLAGAAWIGFALVNWSARGNLLGGIYGRPIALGNFAHFAIGAITLIKSIPRAGDDAIVLTLTAGFAVFAAWFGYVLFGPGPQSR